MSVRLLAASLAVALIALVVRVVALGTGDMLIAALAGTLAALPALIVAAPFLQYRPAYAGMKSARRLRPSTRA